MASPSKPICLLTYLSIYLFSHYIIYIFTTVISHILLAGPSFRYVCFSGRIILFLVVESGSVTQFLVVETGSVIQLLSVRVDFISLSFLHFSPNFNEGLGLLFY